MPMNISYDPSTDIVHINGFKFSSTIFEHLATPTPEGEAIRVIRVDDGIITAERIFIDENAQQA
jgi:hypothetical protein